MLKLFLFIVLFQSAYSANVPSRYRFEIGYGYTISDYNETTFDGNSFSTRNPPLESTQGSGTLETMFQFYIIPPYLDLSFGIEATGVNVFNTKVDGSKIEDLKENDPGAENFLYLLAYGRLGVILPQLSEHIQVKLNIERFYTTMIVKNNEFGFRNLQGWQVFPDIEWLTFSEGRFFKMSTFLKIPLWTDIGSRRETTLGLKFRVPLGGAETRRFPAYAYERALTLKIFYTNLDLTFQNASAKNAEFTIKQYGLGLGLNF